jgi:hypothetical protein
MKYQKFTIALASFATIGIAAISDRGMRSGNSIFADQPTVSANRTESAQEAMVSVRVR